MDMEDGYGRCIWKMDMEDGYERWIWKIDMKDGYGRWICLFKRLLQTRGPYKITSNIKKKHCVNTINITEK